MMHGPINIRFNQLLFNLLFNYLIVRKNVKRVINRFAAAPFQTQHALTTDVEILLFPPQHTPPRNM